MNGEKGGEHMRRWYVWGMLAAVLLGFLVWALARQSERPVGSTSPLRVGPSVPVASDFAGGNSRWPDIAWGGKCYLVVWQEGGGYEGGADSNIYAARLDAEGKTLDPKGIVVCQAKHHQLYPKVTFDGENFLVVWQDYRSGRDWDIYATRISPDGRVLDADGFAIADGPGNQVHPTLDSDGRSTLLIWSDLRPNPNGPERYELAGTLVRQGQPEKRNGTVLSSYARNGSLLGAIARWDGDSYVVVAQRHPSGYQFGGPWFIRVRPNGKVEPVAVDFFGESYTLACDPKSRRSCLWSCGKVGHGSYTCVFQTTLLPDSKHFLIAGLPRTYSPLNELWAAATFNGKNFLVVTERGLDVRADRVGIAIETDLVAVRIDPQTGQPLDLGCLPFPGKEAEKYLKALDAVRTNAPAGVEVAAEKGVFECQPALASSGDGRSLLVYSRHAGPGKFTLRAVLLSE